MVILLIVVSAMKLILKYSTRPTIDMSMFTSSESHMPKDFRIALMLLMTLVCIMAQFGVIGLTISILIL